MLAPKDYPDAEFYAAWRDVILYNEHTWGAHCSISQPDSEFTLSQWKIKQAFALDADRRSRELLAAAVDRMRGKTTRTTAVDVVNTCSWSRSDLVVLPRETDIAGQRVTTNEGELVPSQRLANGQLAFWAESIPPLGSSRFLLKSGPPLATGEAKAHGNVLSNRDLLVRVDEKTGAIGGLTWTGAGVDLAAGDGGAGLNTYSYVAGRDPKDPQTVRSVNIRALDRGPLVASLAIESAAPGCRKLVRYLQVVDGSRRVDITNTVDKVEVRDPESVHFGFTPSIPGGEMRMDIPWATIRPEQDQMPGACKNYFTVGRWIDVANDDFGMTVALVDAPLLEVGKITVDVPSPYLPEVWIHHLEPSQTFYSYVMNNYWETNYKASQEGPTEFRYALLPHGPFDVGQAARFGIERSQPLIVVPVDPAQPPCESLLRVEPPDVMVTSVKPTQDGQGVLVRLFNVGDQTASARLEWQTPPPKRVSMSSPFEEIGPALAQPIEIPSQGIVTLRAELGTGGTEAAAVRHRSHPPAARFEPKARRR